MIEVPDFMKPLETLVRPFPSAAVEEVIARRGESTPYLLEVLAWTEANAAEVPRSFMLHEYALFVLAQFREVRAYDVAVRIARSRHVHQLLGETVSSGLGPILASLSGGDTRLIQTLIEDEEADEFARSSGICAMGALFRTGLLPRQSFSEYLGVLFDGGLRREHSFVWDELVIACTDLGMSEHLEAIRVAFEEGLADPGFEAWHSVQQRLTSDTVSEAELMEFRLIDDAIEEMSWWYCFEEASADEGEDLDGDRDWARLDDLSAFPAQIPGHSVPVRAEPKPGRNDPCPCGSGKKFKKCCGGGEALR